MSFLISGLQTEIKNRFILNFRVQDKFVTEADGTTEVEYIIKMTYKIMQHTAFPLLKRKFGFFIP